MDISTLNEPQLAAVKHTTGPLMILAGAGSGKTKTLVTKIQFLLEKMDISPFQILAVTFSNKAAREMRERVSTESGIDTGALQITTFHSFCSRVLRQEAQYLGLSRNFTIYDTSESKSIIKNVLGKRGISPKEIHPNEILYYIDSVKNAGFYIGCKNPQILEEIDQEDLFFSFYKEYESELHKSNAVDFGGLITGVINLFESFPEVLERYHNRYKYLLVDEYQDTNRAQFYLVKYLAQNHHNICVVGDEDQSIYSWRGADIRNILDFEEAFPSSQLIKLEQNYRSSKKIIEAATSVIENNVHRKGKRMWTDNDDGEVIQVIECKDDREESSFVAKEIQKLVSQGVSPKEIAIFYRTNAQSRQIEDGLRKLHINYRVVAGIKFYERKEVKDLLCYLRCVVNEKDSLAISRVINVPARGVGVQTLRKIENLAVKYNLSLYEALLEIFIKKNEDFQVKLSTKVKNSLDRFVEIIEEAKEMQKQKKLPSEIYQYLLHESNYYQSLVDEKSYEAQARIENLEELNSALVQFEQSEESPSLTGFLETLTLDAEKQNEEGGEDVSMMTIHSAKGLEYEYVFVAGVEENLFPSFQSIDAGEEGLEEERRLFYVAMTRAMKRLYLLFAQGRMLWGSLKFNGPSRFLLEIPDNYYRWEKSGHTNLNRNENEDFNQDTFSDEKVFYRDTPKKNKFEKNEKISHKIYGSGIVLNSDGFEQDEKVTIKFKDGAIKKFLVKFAPISKVK